MTTVLVTGASGRLGRVLVERLAADGHQVRAASRTARSGPGSVRWVVADVATGEGLAEAVAGAEVIVHAASAPYKGRYTAKVEVEGTANLLEAAGRAGVGHLVYVSIVGADRVPMGYYRSKVRAEDLVRGGPVPWTILRATQFHEFVADGFRLLSRLGFLPVDPDVRAQPVALADVAGRLAGLIAAGPARAIVEYGGPRVLGMAEAGEGWLRAQGLRRPIVRVRLPGAMGRAFRAGHLVTAAEPAGSGTWEDYLRQVAAKR
ncbi:SDR family oxidoreductase [Nonomuraea sp. NPDC050328]|uniref:SDR family oxidoreductase n=1 Tax=Nonomuraea sp. NPDC050328 TaxID=3364361 RepID=UPI00378C9734